MATRGPTFTERTLLFSRCVCLVSSRVFVSMSVDLLTNRFSRIPSSRFHWRNYSLPPILSFLHIFFFSFFFLFPSLSSYFVSFFFASPRSVTLLDREIERCRGENGLRRDLQKSMLNNYHRAKLNDFNI